ncbi:MAG: alpha/beta hydrolase, partial [bacterium]
KYLRYRLDESNIEYSQAHFDTFIEQINQFNKQFPVQMTIVAHSMGNRLVMRAAPFISLAHAAIREIDLCSPDVDNETFKHYIEEYRNPDGSVAKFKARLYVSYRDKMLGLSHRMHGGYYRLGEGSESIGTIVSDVGSEDKSDQSQIANAFDVAAPLAREQYSSKQISKRLQTIDFTAVDHGLFGHVLPFELVANMCQTGKPGPGLSLIHEDNPEPKRLEALKKRLKGSTAAAETAAGSVGSCDRVVFTKASN